MEKLTRGKPSKDVLMKALDQKSVDLAEASRTSNFIKRIQVGQRVRLRGLSYSELNDAKGVVVDSDSGERWSCNSQANPCIIKNAAAALQWFKCQVGEYRVDGQDANRQHYSSLHHEC